MDINWLQLFMSIVLILLFGFGTGFFGPRRKNKSEQEEKDHSKV